ncbi:MAG: hypothetical protein JKY65_08205 [Planctomycetes bacterium]|nr:hypothetical protein [Planctomycetota bacterium]
MSDLLRQVVESLSLHPSGDPWQRTDEQEALSQDIGDSLGYLLAELLEDEPSWDSRWSAIDTVRPSAAETLANHSAEFFGDAIWGDSSEQTLGPIQFQVTDVGLGSERFTLRFGDERFPTGEDCSESPYRSREGIIWRYEFFGPLE